MTSDNGQENEKRETLADIERDLRDRADCAERHGDCETHNDGIAMLLRSIADRIEAAWKREKSEVEADALSVGGIVEAARTAEKSSAVGNAAAMREALVTILAEVERFYTNGWIPYYAWETCDGLVKRALAAPVRNCDVFKSEPEMQAAFIDWYNEAFGLKGDKYAIDTCDLKHDVDGILHDYIDWLLAPAAERKGDGDAI